MKFAALIEYVEDKPRIKGLAAEHRAYLRGLLEAGQLFAAGPFADDLGALWILEADSLESANEIVQGDPFNAAGLFSKSEVRALNYWSAKEWKGK